MSPNKELQPPIKTIIFQALSELSCSDFDDSFALVSTNSDFFEYYDDEDDLVTLSDSKIDVAQSVSSLTANSQASRWQSGRYFENSGVRKGEESLGPKPPTRKKTNEESMYNYVRQAPKGRFMPAPSSVRPRPVRQDAVYVDPENNNSSSHVEATLPVIRVPRNRRVSLPSAAKIQRPQLLAQPQRKPSRQESFKGANTSQSQGSEKAQEMSGTSGEAGIDPRSQGVFTPKGIFNVVIRDESSGTESTNIRSGEFAMSFLEQEKKPSALEDACSKDLQESLASAMTPQAPFAKSNALLNISDKTLGGKEEGTQGMQRRPSRGGSVMVSVQEEYEAEVNEEQEEEDAPAGDEERGGRKYVVSFPTTFLEAGMNFHPEGSSGSAPRKLLSVEAFEDCMPQMEFSSDSAAPTRRSSRIELKFRDQGKDSSGVPNNCIYLDLAPKFACQERERSSPRSPKQPFRKESQCISNSELQLVFTEEDFRRTFPNIHRQASKDASPESPLRRAKTMIATGSDVNLGKQLNVKQSFNTPSRAASFDGYLFSRIRSASSA